MTTTELVGAAAAPFLSMCKWPWIVQLPLTLRIMTWARWVAVNVMPELIVRLLYCRRT